MSISKAQRKNILKNARHSCEYCKTPEQYSGMPLEIDHIIPQSLDGTDTLDNLCASCRSCNQYKYNFLTGVDPQTDDEFNLFNPRIQQWSEHFRWSDEKTQIIGISQIGRATVMRLKFNNKLVSIARDMWRKAGWIPPTD